MPNRNYFILFLSFILLVGIFALFNAGYQPENEKKVQKSQVVNSEEPLELKEEEEGEEDGDDEKEKEDEESKEREDVENGEKGREVTKIKGGEGFLNCLYEVRVPSPKAVSFSPGGEELWVTSLMNERAGLFIFNSETGTGKKELNLPDGGGVEIIFDSSAGYVSQMETGRAFKIENREIQEVYDSGSVWSKAFAFSPDYQKLYLSNWVGNDVSEFDDSGKLIRKIPTVETPRGISVVNHSLYVAGFKNGEIQKIDLQTGDSKIIFSTGGAMRDAETDGKNIYFSDMAMGKIYSTTPEGEVVKIAKTDRNPNTIRLTPDGKILVISNRGINNPESYYLPGPEWGSLLFFDLEKEEIIGSHIGGNQTTGLSISPDGSLLAYSDFLDHRVTVCKFPDEDSFSNWSIEEHKRKINK